MDAKKEVQVATAEMLTNLLKELITNQKRSVGLEHQLWEVDDIAHYLNRCNDYTRRNIITQATFPPMRPVPTCNTSNRFAEFWRAQEVIEWAMAIDKNLCSFNTTPRNGRLLKGRK